MTIYFPFSARWLEELHLLLFHDGCQQANKSRSDIIHQWYVRHIFEEKRDTCTGRSTSMQYMAHDVEPFTNRTNWCGSRGSGGSLRFILYTQHDAASVQKWGTWNHKHQPSVIEDTFDPWQQTMCTAVSHRRYETKDLVVKTIVISAGGKRKTKNQDMYYDSRGLDYSSSTDSSSTNHYFLDSSLNCEMTHPFATTLDSSTICHMSVFCVFQLLTEWGAQSGVLIVVSSPRAKELLGVSSSILL